MLSLNKLIGLSLALTLTQCGPDPNDPSACSGAWRRYATRFVAGNLTYNCRWDAPTLSLICTNDIYTFTTTYASTADFVAEGSLPGQLRATKTRESCNGTMYGMSGTYTKDAMGQVTKYQNIEDPSMGSLTISLVDTFVKWDGVGRPTSGHHHSQAKTNYCDLTTSWSYDDVARTVNYVPSDVLGGFCGVGPGNFCGGDVDDFSLSTVSTYDADGIVSSVNGKSYDTQARAVVCSD